MDDVHNQSQMIMTAKEVGAYLKLPMTTLYEMAAKGRLRGVKCGRQWRFMESDVLNYLHGIPAPQAGVPGPEKRNAPRIKCALSAVLTGLLPETESLKLSGLIRDLSAGGLYFAASTEHDGSAGKFAASHPVKISFTVDEPRAAVLEVKGRVVRCVVPASGGARAGWGIKFRHLSQEHRELICDYVG